MGNVVQAGAGPNPALAASKEGRLGEEITPVSKLGRDDGTMVEQDEGIRPGTTADRLARLTPAFSPDGTIAAGSASQLSDGGCAVVVMDWDEAERLGLTWLAEIGGYGTLGIGDLDLIEINEAFAGVALASLRDLGVPHDRVNVNGGAIALGHPVGMSGARVALTLALELRRRGGGTGAAALCGGGGQGDALILHVGQKPA
jgi:acetyl-CoA C-acetyltransferase